MKELAEQAVKAIDGFKNNKTIMDFVTAEAYEKVAAEMRKAGASCTAKAVELLSYRHTEIKKTVDNYINVGLIGCYMARFKAD